jgi:hypothetical protein
MTYKDEAINRLKLIGLTSQNVIDDIIKLLADSYITSIFDDFADDEEWDNELILNDLDYKIVKEFDIINNAIRVKDNQDYAICISDLKRIFNNLGKKYDFEYFDMKFIADAIRDQAEPRDEVRKRMENENYSSTSMPKDNELFISYGYITESYLRKYIEKRYDKKGLF